MNESKKRNKMVALVLSAALAVSSAFVAVCSADGVSYEDIMDNTRYVWNDIHDISTILEWVEATQDGSLPFQFYDKYKEYMAAFGASSAEMTNQALIAYANASTSGDTPISADIKDSYSIVCKRKIVYPYDDYVETDYLYIYVDENQDIYSPQQFGAYGVTANSALLVRDTNFDGVHAYSIPFEDNGITFYPSYYNSSIAFRINGNEDNTFIYDAADGRHTTGFRHKPSDFLECKNNTVNTIQCNNLVDLYNESSVAYHYYLAEHETMSVFECFCGTGYAYEMSSGFATFLPPWYVSSGYFNTQNDIPYVQNNTYNNQTYVNNPALPPVYIMPSDNPWHSGNTIDENTIDNYNDYGLDINNNKFELDIPVLAGALGAAITPTLQGLIEGTFALQPDIGLQFGLPDVPSVNMIDLFDDLIGDIVVYPPVEITRPQVPAITTLTSFGFNNLNIVSTSAQLPAEYKQPSRVLWSSGESIMNALGVSTSIIFALALFGLLVWVIF